MPTRVTRLVRLAGIAVLVAFPGAVLAQTAGRGHGTLPAPGQGRCALCHSPHAPEARPACAVPALLLPAELARPESRTGAACGATGSELAAARGVSPVSRSCLRCHVTPDVSTGEAVPASSRPVDVGTVPARTFLGDLVDDHPLAVSPDRPDEDPIRTLPMNDPGRAFLRPDGRLVAGRTFRPECTSCHRVHRGPDSALGEEGRTELCVGCHERARYQATHSAAACADCHAPHGGGEASLLKRPTAAELCRSCHDRSADVQGLVAPPRRVDLDAHASGARPGQTCAACHTVHP